MNVRDNVFKENNQDLSDSTKTVKKASKNFTQWISCQLLALDQLRKQSFISVIEKNYLFAMYITLIGLIYIFNSLHAEKQAAQVDRLMKENKELKSEYMTLNAKLSLRRRQSEVLEAADTVGLRLLNNPPFKLTYKKN